MGLMDQTQCFIGISTNVPPQPDQPPSAGVEPTTSRFKRPTALPIELTRKSVNRGGGHTHSILLIPVISSWRHCRNRCSPACQRHCCPPHFPLVSSPVLICFSFLDSCPTCSLPWCALCFRFSSYRDIVNLSKIFTSK
jgi:hypothetical protein